MPIYEYECGNCGHRLETIQKFSDEPLTDCPECQQATLKKLVSAAAFHLKGNGWYVTDFRGDKKDNGKAKDDTPDKASPKETKSEKSPAKNDNGSGSGSGSSTKSTSSSTGND